MSRKVVAWWGAVALLALVAAPSAYADDCTGLTDCSTRVKVALLLLAVLATAVALYVFFEILGPMLISSLFRGAAADAVGAGLRGAGTAASEREAIAAGIRAELGGLNPTGSATNCWRVAEAADNALGGAVAEAPLPAYPAADLGLVESGYGGSFQATTVGQIEQQMAAQEGARGLVAVQWQNGTGHVFNVVNRGGDVFWIDASAPGVRVSTSAYQTLGTGARNIVNSWLLPTYP